MPRGSCRPAQGGADACDLRWFIWWSHTFTWLPHVKNLLNHLDVHLQLRDSNQAKADLRIQVEVSVFSATFGPCLFPSPSCSAVLFMPCDTIQSKCILRSDLKKFSPCVTAWFSVMRSWAEEQLSPTQSASSLSFWAELASWILAFPLN